MPFRRTRIVATLGPACDSPEILRKVLEAGVNVARINFSHGAPEAHVGTIEKLRKAAENLGRPVAVLADLPGPKLRVKISSPRTLTIGDSFSFSLADTAVDESDAVITEPEMLFEVKPGQRILLDDGRLQLEAKRNEGGRLFAEVVVGGTLLPNKGVNLPDTPLTVPALTDRDKAAIGIAIQAGADWLALSFVRNPEAAIELRSEAGKYGFDGAILAKLERPEAVTNAEAIIDAFDGAMVARGDLGVEIPLEQVPTAQKKIIAICRALGRPVITATDMLDSMRNNPRPTRAEASDVANAIFDGTDAVMLSGETAVGQYPVEAVKCMASIALEAESMIRTAQSLPILASGRMQDSLDDHITQTVVDMAAKIKADAIITPTLSGRSARQIARHRPKTAIVAPAPSEDVMRRMAIIWGVQPVLMDYCRRAGDDRIGGALKASYEAGVVKTGMRVIVMAGHPIEGGAHLPTIRFVRCGEGGEAVEP